MQGNVNIPDSTITTNLSFRQLVLMNMQQLTNFPYIENDFDALTDYELLCLVVKFLNDVIANQNEQNDSITRMYESFLALQTYVNNTKDTLEDAFNELDDYVRNYFDNLDVQEEINNKLDEMLEDGVLEQIIEQFLQSTAVWCFNTVNDMKAATNLVSGSDARTLGYYSVNDGGGALYHITNEVSQTDLQEELGTNLYANLIVDENTNILHYGAIKGNDSSESQTINNTAISTMISKQNKLVIPTGTFYISQPITINNINVDCKGVINYSGNNFAVIITKLNYKNININQIVTTTGGAILLQPTTGNDITYNNFEVVNIAAYNQSLLLDGTNGSIALNNFNINRVRSSDNIPIEMKIDNGSSKWITENAFIGIDIKSPNNYGVFSNATGTSVEIQYKLDRCDLEGCKGIHSSNKTTFITLSNCRLNEISDETDWLWVENTRPQINILGEGILYPSKMKFENLTAGRVVFTNMQIQTHTNGYYYLGGVIGTNFIYKLDDTNYAVKNITAEDLTDDHYYTLPTTYNENQFNAFSTSLTAWIDITVPNNYKEFYFKNNTVGQRIFRTNTHYTQIDNMETGFYKMFYLDSRICYIKLNRETA